MKMLKRIFVALLALAATVAGEGFVMPVAVAQTPGASSSGAAKRLIGAIKSINGNALVLGPDSGSDVNVTIQETTRIVQIAPGEKNLKNATPMSLSDLQVGDRILVGGSASEPQSIVASSIVVMKRSDVESLHAKQEQDWQKRGVGGIVDSVDSGTGTVMISQTGFSGKRIITVHTSKDTIVRRYAPDSVKFEDAKPSTLDQIHVGDQLRVRGTRNSAGNEIAAEEVVSGTFHNLAGTVNSVDASAGTVSVQDLLSKKNVVVKISADSNLRKLPPEVAQQFAMRLKRAALGSASGAAGSSGSAGAAPGRNGEGRESQTQAPGSERNRSPSGMGGGGMRAGGAPDFQQMLGRMPAVASSDLHKGDAVLVLTTQGTPGSPGTAITLLSGVEPILQAAPSGSQATVLTPWNLGGPPGGDLASQ